MTQSFNNHLHLTFMALFELAYFYRMQKAQLLKAIESKEGQVFNTYNSLGLSELEMKNMKELMSFEIAKIDECHKISEYGEEYLEQTLRDFWNTLNTIVLNKINEIERMQDKNDFITIQYRHDIESIQATLRYNRAVMFGIFSRLKDKNETESQFIELNKTLRYSL